MMKHVFAGILLSILFVSGEVSALHYLQSTQKRIRLLGESIERVDNVPLIDKLTNFLPFAMVAACLKECPGQTMMVLTGLLVYALFANDKFRSTLRKYSPFITKQLTRNKSQFDDSLFVFEGDDEMMQEEIAEEIFEEELIAEELFFDDEYSDFLGNKETIRNRTIEFL